MNDNNKPAKLNEQRVREIAREEIEKWWSEAQKEALKDAPPNICVGLLTDADLLEYNQTRLKHH